MATSELSQFLENVDEKVLECTICFKRLQNPKSLNCLHTFCLACLEDWVKEKGKLTCPTCSKSCCIPKGGLQKLPPNTILNNLLETIDQFSKTSQMKCICKGQAKYYCQECRHYLCSTCSDHHKILPMSEKHKLHSVEDVRSMTPLQIASLHPPLCSHHNKTLEFFCSICNIPICMHCTITDHNAWEGNHKPISISKAFQTFKETSATLEKAASDCKNKLQDGLKAVIQNVTELQQSKDTSLKDIDNHVQVLVKIIKQNADKIKNKVESIYKKKKKVLDIQMDKLKTTISDINTKLSFLNHLLKCDEATAMQSSERLSTAMKDIINELPKTRPNDNGKIKFVINENQFHSLKKCDIGYVSHSAAEYLTLKGANYVTQGQTIIVKVIKTNECEIHANQLKATWTQPTGKANVTQVQEDDNGDYFVTRKCTSLGVCKLDVSADGEPIKQSPMIIKVEKEGLVNTIHINKDYVTDIVKCGDDCLIFSCHTNEMLKYKQSGEYICTIMLPQVVRVNKMYTMKNGNIAFSDSNSGDIKVCNMNGQVIKSTGQIVIMNTEAGIHVDEASNVVYVVDVNNGCVVKFDIDSGQKIGWIGSDGNRQYRTPSGIRSGIRRVTDVTDVADVTLTNQGLILILEKYNKRLLLFNNEGSFIKILVGGYKNDRLANPCEVVVDEDDNIIIASNYRLQLFSSDGKFIKRIDKEEDGINYLCGLTIISYHPRRVAIANNGNRSINIFNY
ncbi:tripartite motif-containing protein 45-like [Anneissia japonica]|uniref:tripartite motif-containing protein 45-like n=1 Tax=Anneissia japonica TaxID=1529436 RepID=UPI00142573A2|nr:tripartite motif-containing protein 45-like [Anneissia japonica]